MQTPYENVFGNNWVLDAYECETGIERPVDRCEEDSAIKTLVEDICYVFINPEGPLGDCLEFVNEDAYYDACIYDLCYTDPGNDIICGALQEYVQQCREANGIIGNWREGVLQCPFECPSDKTYQPCGSACQPSCAEPEAELNCTLPCHETCSCPEGQLDDGGQCVEPENCGCTLPDGSYISAGMMWINDDCSQSCRCTGGVAECVAYGCREYQECRLKGNVRDCYCLDKFTYDGEQCVREPGTCTIWGDPHYITFDNVKYDFQGDCEYTLVRPCSNQPGMVDFHIWGDNVKDVPSSTVSLMRHISLEVNGTVYSVSRGNIIYRNGERRNSPVIDSNGVLIRSGVKYTTIQTYFGVSIRYDGEDTAHIQVPFEYWNATCGLCGTFDDDRDNDFRLPDGTKTEYVNVFGNSWVQNAGECDTTITDPIDQCEDDEELDQEIRDICYIFIDPDGPLGNCFDYVDPKDYYEACIYDLCHTDPGSDIICPALQEYAQQCREANGLVGLWRAARPQCAFECPSDRLYELCGSACHPSCAEPEAAISCSLPCQETCTCRDGKLDDRGQCVEPSECGCLVADGVYISPTDTWTSPDCSQRCTCFNGEAQCEAYGCGENEECDLRNGVQDCYCLDGFLPLGERCVRAPGFCQIWGDPHYVTFDDKKYNFQGDCDYTLVRDCQNSSEYHLWSNNERLRPSDRVSYLREVILELKGNIYSLIKGFHVRVNGIDVSENLPYMDSEVWIYRDVTSMNLVTDFLWVSYDGQDSANVYLGYNAGRTCGLCGSFDGDRTNDLMLPSGEMARSVTEFGNSWVVNPDQCDDVDPGPTDPCDNGVTSLEDAVDLCYYLKDPLGPFASCHSYVDPDDHYDSCLYDVCEMDDDALCASLEQYAQACKSKGGNPGTWRVHVPECRK
eukprot:XP_780739.3 PREDICTED: zonadhesin-like [Strongylocentrotus purpuratus]